MKRTPVQEKRPPDATEAWILGSGTAALASAFYLIRDAKIPPLKVHLLNPHKSFQRALHDKGDSHRGYDQFVRCLPVPVGAPLEKLLSLVPGGRAHFVHDEIEAEDGHRDTTKHGRDTYVLIQSSQTLTEVPIKASSLDFRHRIRLLCLMLKNERYLWKGQIRNYFPESFFKSAFWAIWSVQYVIARNSPPSPFFLLDLSHLLVNNQRLGLASSLGIVPWSSGAHSNNILVIIPAWTY